MSTSKYLNGNGLSEAWTNTKNYIASQLLGKQDTLVSGTNIKTVNNQSLLTVSNTTATVFNYDSSTETLEIQVNG